MKRYILAAICSATVSAITAQPGTTKPAAKKPASILKSENDSASYAAGMSIANYYRKQGVTKMNSALIAKAVNDIFNGNPTLLNDQSAGASLNDYVAKCKLDKAKPIAEAGKKFMAENKKKPGVITTASGLQYQVIKEGSGPKPAATDSVTCNYIGAFLDGNEFDNSFKRGQPITFSLQSVIPGWTEALQLMSPGAKYKLWVPYNLGYGTNDFLGIPGGSTLVFEVELLEVKKKQ